jgi:AcrR family transcriptional regulator
MRDVAAEAGVATGAAYYYFRSKEDLVMGFYKRTAEESRESVIDALGTTTDLRKRIRALIEQKLEQFAKHRRLLAGLVRVGIDPRHPLSPFGPETKPMRDESIESFRQAIDGANVRIPKDLADDLPRLLWLYLMGIIFFWIFDESKGQVRTRRLLDGTLELVVRLLQMGSLPLMGPVRKKVVAVLRAIDE